MRELNLSNKIKTDLENFCQGLRKIYGSNLLAVILYGSAASGEFIENRSDINILAVLEDTDLAVLKKAGGLIKRFRNLKALFLSEDYIRTSVDIFPIEFLDMQENYLVLLGRDVLEGLPIDTLNLRFQCEQELKSKLINLRQFYLGAYRDKGALNNLLYKAVNSILHILRNVLRLRGRKAPYLKTDILSEAALEFNLNTASWYEILHAKSLQRRLSLEECERLFTALVRELEKIIDIVDKA